MTTAKVSLLMPFKNTAPYIEECIRSIKLQSYQNWELLAVNDHSTDGSELIVDEQAAKDNRIHHIINSGSGIIDALKTAFAQASGQYVSRMDSDDIMPWAYCFRPGKVFFRPGDQ